MSSATSENQAVEAKLGLWDAISIIIGIIIGAGIYETPRSIFGMMPNEWWTLGLWAFCGLLALIGALCYAELATAYPRSGGDYVYQTQAYGPLMGYLFGWTQLAVIQTSSIGLMAYVFADYGKRLWEIPGAGRYSTAIFAAGAIIVMSLLNILGVVLGKLAQNLLTLAKVLGLGGIVAVGFFYAPKQDVVIEGQLASIQEKQLVLEIGSSSGKQTFQLSNRTRFFLDDSEFLKDKKKNFLLDAQGNKIKVSWTQFSPAIPVRVVTDLKDFSLARKVKQLAPLKKEEPASPGFPWGLLPSSMVLVLLTYGGWNDAAFVAAEVRNRSRNIPLALIVGTAGVTLIYLLVNAAYLTGLGGIQGARETEEVAADVLTLLPWEFGEKAMSLLVMISALGAVNGLIFTSSRIYSTLGADYSLFSVLGRWNKKFGTPVWALLIQMGISLALVLAVGTDQGKNAINEGLMLLGQREMNLEELEGQGGFILLLRCTAPIFWVFFLLTGMALFVLRLNDPGTERPFKVPFYPFLPFAFCAYCGYMIHSGINYAGSLGLVGLALVVGGIPLFVFSRRTVGQKGTSTGSP